MNVRLKKAFAELWLNPGRAVLIIIALVMGMWGLGSNLVSYWILSKDLNANYTGTLPPHVILTSKDFARLDLEELRSRSEIRSVEFRDLSYQRIEVFPDQWLPVWLFGVDDFSNMQIARIYHEQGSRIPKPGTMLIERNGQLISDLGLDSTARLRVGSQLREIQISGISFDPAQAPATQDAFIYAYMDKPTFSTMSSEQVDKRLIIRLSQENSREEVHQVAKKIVAEFESEGIKLETVSVPKFEEHPHQFQLNTLIAFQASIGFLALLMAAVLVSQLMQAIMAQQVRQIGVLKAIGARRSQVFVIYMTQVFLLGVVAILIALPITVVSGFAFAKFVSTVLNFNILTTTLALKYYLVISAVGLLLPVIFTFPVIKKATGFSVAEALSDYGINSTSLSISTSYLPKVLVSNVMRMSSRNLFRNKSRMALTMTLIALGVAIFSAGFNVRQSLVNFLDESKQALKYDVQVVFKNSISVEKATAPFVSLFNVQHIETWSGGRGRLQTEDMSAGDGIGVVALPFDSQLVKRDVIKGRWLNPNGELEIVINQRAAERLLPAVVGEILSINFSGKEVNARLVGIIKEFDVDKIYIDKRQYDRLVNPEMHVNSLMLSAKDRSHASVMMLKKNVEKSIEKSQLNVLYVMSQTERVRIIYNHLSIILTFFGLLSLLVLIVSALGMASTTGINIFERTREIGVMRAIGATPKDIYSLFVTEGMLTSGIGVIIGLIASLPLSAIAARFFGNLILGHDVSLDFAFSQSGLAVTLSVIIVFSWLASRIPAKKAIVVSTRSALSYE